MVEGRLRQLREEAVSTCLRAGLPKILSVVVGLMVLIAIADWAVGDRGSLGVLYILPMMIGALVLGPLETLLLAAVSAFLRAWFDTPAPQGETILRFAFALFAHFASGLFIRALVRNRKLAVDLLGKIEREQD